MYSVTFISTSGLLSVATPNGTAARILHLALRACGIPARRWYTANKHEPRLIA